MRKLLRTLEDQGGYTLLAVLMLLVALGVSSAGAVLMVGQSRAVSAVSRLQYDLEAAAEAGVEEWRARLNANPALFPAVGRAVLEDAAPYVDADGATVPGIVRTVYAGPSGDPSGQYGVFGSVVAVAEAAGGQVRAIRRGEMLQESFARFAYFTDSEGVGIGFGGGDELAGPVHSNDRILIYDSGVTFRDRVTTAESFSGARYARFLGGAQEAAPEIPMPTTAELSRLRTFAAQGSAAFAGSALSAPGSSSVRIEFLTFDVDADGSIGPDEGFFRLYRSLLDNHTGSRWVTADVPSTGIEDSRNCGDFHGSTFWSAWAHENNAPGAPNENAQAALTRSNSRCFPAGAEALSGGSFRATDPGLGAWQRSFFDWPADTPQRLRDRADFAYLFPLSRRYNPSFRGVIHFTGRVAISGVVRGRVTVAATDEIVVIDDLTYSAGVGTGPCPTADILGLFAGTDVVVADNTINSPSRAPSGSSYHSHDDTNAETIQAVVLALQSFTVENFAAGSDAAEGCGAVWGRGCLVVDGGIIQRTRGPVGQTSGSSGGTGYLKRYAYDECAGKSPPPFFPTTGYFLLNRIYDVDPAGFDVAAYFQEITAR